MNILAGLIVIVATYAVAAGFHAALPLPGRTRTAALVFFLAVITAAPLILVEAPAILRFVVALNSAVVCMKLYDAHIGASRGYRAEFGAFVGFLFHWPGLVQRKPRRLPRVHASEDVHSAIHAAAKFVLAVAVLVFVFLTIPPGVPLLLEHSVKIIPLFIASCSLLDFWCIASRLAGRPSGLFVNAPFSSRTPAEFWRRYNLVVGQFLYEDVFVLAGGGKAPVRAALMAFFVSGVIHEAIFSSAVGHLQGYQMAYFALQAVAVVATMRFKPKGNAAIAATVATICFNLVSSLLFALSVDEVVPFFLSAR